MASTLAQTEQTAYQTMFDKAPLGVVIIDPQGIVVWLNNLAKSFLGSGVSINQIMLSTTDWPRFRELLSANKSFYYFIGEQGFIFIPQPVAQEQDRTLLWIVPSASMEIDLLKMQQDLIRQRKLANLGKMMAEMAHELNNPLAGISMGCQLIGMSLKKLRKLVTTELTQHKEALETLDKMEQELVKVTNSTGRAASLRQELLAYSKPNKLVLRPYQASKLIQQALSNFESRPIFRNMTIHKEWAEESPTILCDSSKLEQILYNLFKNAHDATHGQGEIWLRELVEEHQVIIEIEDSGPGIPAEMIDKIFSPFLTTKPRTGTGLGLSISQQIIQELGGTISVYNKTNSGACFQITLPVQKNVLS